ncbi:SPW repeat domain-containing protein [Candidatus Palauibacter sp.]|uniref:SPW repeat domain-containing protein n=1 Tax=Candidatus Palauibacter sp. TaxID=3101350 RepID=UPI003B02E5AD
MASRWVGLALGLWFLGAPFIWGYPFGFLWWHSVVLGGSILVVTITFNLGINRISGWGLIALGAYSMLSPFIHGYLANAQALFNDLIFGVITVGTGTAMGGAGIEHSDEAHSAA